MVTILNGKPLTRHYGYGFPAGLNMATHTLQPAQNPWVYPYPCRSLHPATILGPQTITQEQMHLCHLRFIIGKAQAIVMPPRVELEAEATRREVSSVVAG